jgi:hypothetical protein
MGELLNAIRENPNFASAIAAIASAVAAFFSAAIAIGALVIFRADRRIATTLNLYERFHAPEILLSRIRAEEVLKDYIGQQGLTLHDWPASCCRRTTRRPIGNTSHVSGISWCNCKSFVKRSAWMMRWQTTSSDNMWSFGLSATSNGWRGRHSIGLLTGARPEKRLPNGQKRFQLTMIPITSSRLRYDRIATTRS